MKPRSEKFLEHNNFVIGRLWNSLLPWHTSRTFSKISQRFHLRGSTTTACSVLLPASASASSLNPLDEESSEEELLDDASGRVASGQATSDTSPTTSRSGERSFAIASANKE
jgi:hypothetical protein